MVYHHADLMASFERLSLAMLSEVGLSIESGFKVYEGKTLDRPLFFLLQVSPISRDSCC